eukprot:359814-Chlamydomonas_euryale.AAC.2
MLLQPCSAAGRRARERAHHLHRPSAQPVRCIPAEVHQDAVAGGRFHKPVRHGATPCTCACVQARAWAQGRHVLELRAGTVRSRACATAPGTKTAGWGAHAAWRACCMAVHGCMDDVCVHMSAQTHAKLHAVCCAWMRMQVYTHDYVAALRDALCIVANGDVFLGAQ